MTPTSTDQAWQVVAPTAMLEVVNGYSETGREIPTTAFFHSGQIIKKPLPATYVERYLDNDPLVRAAVTFGRVDVETDDDGVDYEVFVPTGGPSRPTESTGSTTDAPAASEEDGKEPEPDPKIAELEEQVTRLQGQLEAEKTAATDITDALQAKLREAEDMAAGALSYGDLSPEALKAEAEKKDVTVTRGDGKDGDPVKADYVKALEAARAS